MSCHFLIQQNPIEDVSLCFALEKLFEEPQNLTEEKLAKVLDSDHDGDIDQIDQNNFFQNHGLTEQEFGLLAHAYFTEFEYRQKTVDVFLWHAYEKGNNVDPAALETNQIGDLVYIHTNRYGFFGSEISRIQITGLIVCVGVILYDPKTKKTFAAHYSPEAQIQTLQVGLDFFLSEHIPLKRLEAKIFYGSPNTGTEEKGETIEEFFSFHGIPSSTHLFISESHEVTFDIRDGSFWQLPSKKPDTGSSCHWRDSFPQNQNPWNLLDSFSQL